MKNIKKIIITALLVLPLTSHAAWWDFFKKSPALEVKPEVSERFVEVPVEKIIEKVVEKPVEKTITKTVQVDNPTLIAEISRLKEENATIKKQYSDLVKRFNELQASLRNTEKSENTVGTVESITESTVTEPKNELNVEIVALCAAVPDGDKLQADIYVKGKKDTGYVVQLKEATANGVKSSRTTGLKKSGVIAHQPQLITRGSTGETLVFELSSGSATKESVVTIRNCSSESEKNNQAELYPLAKADYIYYFKVKPLEDEIDRMSDDSKENREKKEKMRTEAESLRREMDRIRSSYK